MHPSLAAFPFRSQLPRPLLCFSAGPATPLRNRSCCRIISVTMATKPGCIIPWPRLFTASPLKPSISVPPLRSSFSLTRFYFRIHIARPIQPHGHRLVILLPHATADQQQQGQVQGDEIVDRKILQYCSLDKKEEKKSLGELEQEFLLALQTFYYEGKAIMSNEEFDNLKEELMWEGSSVIMLSSDEQRFLEASMAYVAGEPILSDEEFDKLKIKLKSAGSKIVAEGPRCSLRSKKVYSDLCVDYSKMVLLNVPAALIALGLFFFLDDLTGFKITYHLELPEPLSFVFTWLVAVPFIFVLSQAITKFIVKDFLILKGPCPNCATENISFFGTILSVSNGGSSNTVQCSNCGTQMVYDSRTRLITLPEAS